jgi:hypothetical protein
VRPKPARQEPIDTADGSGPLLGDPFRPAEVVTKVIISRLPPGPLTSTERPVPNGIVEQAAGGRQLQRQACPRGPGRDHR